MSTYKRVSGNLIFETLGNSNQFVFQGPTANAATVIIDGNLTVSGNATLSGNISGDKLFNGTSSIEIQTAGGNANITIGGVSNVAVFSTSGLNVTGNTVSSANITGANLVTAGVVTSVGNVIGGNLVSLGNVFINRDAGVGTPTIRFNDVDTVVTANSIVGSIEWYTGDLTSPGARITSAVRSTYIDTSGNAKVEIFTGQTANLEAKVTILPSGNVGIANANPDTLFSANGTAYISGNTTVVANVQGGNLLTAGLVSATGNVTGGNLRTGGLISAAGNINAANIILSGSITTGAAGISTTGNVDGGNLRTSGIVSATGNIDGDNLKTQGIVSATGNITGNNISAGNVITTGILNATSNVSAAGNVTGSNLVTAGTVTAVGSVTAGNLITAGLVSATGNIVSGGYFIGDGGFLSNITAISNVTTSQITNGTTVFAITGSNGDIFATVSGVGNVLTISPTTVTTNGIMSATGNIRGGNLVTPGAVSATGNVNAGNVNATTGSFTTVIGAANASSLTSGTVPSDRLTGIYTINISGYAATANTVTVAAQPNITSLGNLTSLVVVGNVAGGNINTAGQVSAVGNLTGGNAFVTTLANVNDLVVRSSQTVGSTLSVTGNITGANLRTAGTVSATGNLIGGNVQGGANVFATTHTGTTVSVTANITGGNIISGAVITAAGAIQGASLSTTGDVTTTANVSGGNLIAATAISATSLSGTTFSATGNITGGNLIILGQVSSTGNITGGNVIASGAASVSSIIKTGSNAVGNIGSSSNYFNQVFATATTALYADLAEKYTADANYEPGTVVSFGGYAEITKSLQDADRRVAGVISSKPSYLMNAGLEASFVAVVALQGRVHCRVAGPVQKGDMMVSNGDGRARAEANPLPGSIIGKALENFDGASGTIEIVVGRI